MSKRCSGLRGKQRHTGCDQILVRDEQACIRPARSRARSTTEATQVRRCLGCGHTPPAPVSSTQACVVPGGLPRGRAIVRGQPQHEPRAQDHPNHQGREQHASPHFFLAFRHGVVLLCDNQGAESSPGACECHPLSCGLRYRSCHHIATRPHPLHESISPHAQEGIAEGPACPEQSVYLGWGEAFGMLAQQCHNAPAHGTTEICGRACRAGRWAGR